MTLQEIMMQKTKVKSLIVFVFLLTLFYGFTFILIDFIDTPVSSIKDIFLVSLRWGYMVAMTAVLLYFLSVNKYIFAVTFPILSVLCSVLSYYKLTFHVELTQMVIDLALVNDFRTSFDAISWQLVLLIIIILLLSILTVIYRFKHIKVKYGFLQLIAFFLLLFFIDSNYTISKPLVRHTPYSIYYSFKSYFENKRLIAETRPDFQEKVQCKSDSITVVFVLGESLSAKNMQINGYKRNTTPYICKEKNLINLSHIYSEYGYTHESVPYILTRADHQHPDIGYEERSFISLFKKAGFKTTWLANQESINTFVYFMNECDTLINVSNGKSLFIFSKWLDEDILPHYKKVLKNGLAKQFLLVHTVGSHWYYNNHYPERFKKYNPVTQSKIVSSNSHEEIINAYDNTILYSDYIWHLLINELRHRNAILIYLSDHSENLGEDGHYTHGDGDWPAQHYPGGFVWYSDKFKSLYPDKISHLEQNKDKAYNTSFLFYSILDAGDIYSSFLNHPENIFR